MPPPPTAAAVQRIIWAEPDEATRHALAPLLQSLWAELIQVGTGQEILDVCKRSRGDLLIVSSSYPHLDYRSLVRVLCRHPDTCWMSVIIVNPPGMDPHRAARLEGLEVDDILDQPLVPAAFLEAVNDALASAAGRRQVLCAMDPQKTPHTHHVEGNNALLRRRVRCPFHQEEIPVDRYILRAGKLVTEISFFDLPIYRSAARGADFVNFHLLHIAVCPKCLFATNEPTYWADPHETKLKMVQHNPLTKKLILDSHAERLAIARNLSPHFFDHQRTMHDAIVAHELAIATSKTIHQANKYTMPIELLRIANYHLRLAHLYELEQDPEARETSARAAMEWLRKAYLILDGPALYKAIYQIVALCITTGDDRAAYQYLSRMAEFARDPKISRDDKIQIDRYLPRLKKAWEDREDHRDFVHPEEAPEAA
jgi:DNA-binding response OmpR family regulator